jgi:hypothetical protein
LIRRYFSSWLLIMFCKSTYVYHLKFYQSEFIELALIISSFTFHKCCNEIWLSLNLLCGKKIIARANLRVLEIFEQLVLFYY